MVLLLASRAITTCRPPQVCRSNRGLPTSPTPFCGQEPQPIVLPYRKQPPQSCDGAGRKHPRKCLHTHTHVPKYAHGTQPRRKVHVLALSLFRLVNYSPMRHLWSFQLTSDVEILHMLDPAAFHASVCERFVRALVSLVPAQKFGRPSSEGPFSSESLRLQVAQHLKGLAPASARMSQVHVGNRQVRWVPSQGRECDAN